MKLYKPKDDYDKAMQNHTFYVELLKDLHKELNLKVKKGKGYQLAKNRVELFDLATKLDNQIRILQNKVHQYNHNFLPMYNAELEECKKGFKAIYEEALKIVSENSNKKGEIFDKIKDILADYHQLKMEDQNHIEIQNVLYKDLKMLIGFKNGNKNI
tara:strand:+ start:1335 stop:1805 length:471 start_codon:yes stop_codon:yes gene_type:complete